MKDEVFTLRAILPHGDVLTVRRTDSNIAGPNTLTLRRARGYAEISLGVARLRELPRLGDAPARPGSTPLTWQAPDYVRTFLSMHALVRMAAVVRRRLPQCRLRLLRHGSVPSARFDIDDWDNTHYDEAHTLRRNASTMQRNMVAFLRTNAREVVQPLLKADGPVRLRVLTIGCGCGELDCAFLHGLLNDPAIAAVDMACLEPNVAVRYGMPGMPGTQRSGDALVKS